MPIPVDGYLGRVTPWQSGHARFTATVSGTLQPICDAQVVIASLPSDFDIDDAIGAQLDVVGEWVGRSRQVQVPLPPTWFVLDGTNPARGFDRGVWKGPYSGQSGISALDDETYRRLLYANILAKRWDGTIPGAQAAFDAFFIDPDTRVFVQDNSQARPPTVNFAFDTIGLGFDQGFWQDYGRPELIGATDMAMTIGVSGKLPPPIILALLKRDGIPIKPGGVQTEYSVVTVDDAPLFGFDVDTPFISGFDIGALGADPDYVALIDF